VPNATWKALPECDSRVVFSDQPLPDPASGMALLLRCVLVRDQPPVDHHHERIDRRPSPRRIRLTRRRHRRLQRLPDGAPMHAVTVSQLTDRQLLQPPISPDLLEQFHP